MTLFYILFGIFWVSLGAVFGRIDGGGITKTYEWVERILVMFSFLLTCSLFAGPLALIALIGVVGIATGHGQYFPSITTKYIKPERLDIVVKRFFGNDPRTNHSYANIPDGDKRLENDISIYGKRKLYFRCLFGMFITGSLVGLPSYILGVSYGYPEAVLFLLTGPIKALSYAISEYITPGYTELAEYLNGGGRYLICLMVIILLIS